MESKKNYKGSIIKYGDAYGIGSYSDVYMADFKDGICAYKEFWDSEYIAAINERIQNISQYYGDERFVLPFSFIYNCPNDEFFEGYVTNFMGSSKNFEELKNKSREEKVHILKQGRDLIEGLHNDYNIIHCDLGPWNFMYDENNDRSVLLDFDTNIDLLNKENKVSEKIHSEILIEYFKNYGIDKDADIFLYNLACFAFLNDCNFFNVLNKIKSGDFGDIESSQVEQILSTYKDFDKPKSIKKEYIINYL